jgi:hypothetical protein
MPQPDSLRKKRIYTRFLTNAAEPIPR